MGHYLSYLISERAYVVDKLTVELPSITCESVRLLQQPVLSQMYIATYAQGILLKEDALGFTNFLETTFKPRVLSGSQLPIVRSLLLPASSNYVYNKTLKDSANVNLCVETWLYLGDRKDR